MRISDWSSDVCSSDLNGWLGRRLMAQDLVDEVEFGAGEPFGARHVAPAEDFRIGLVCHDLEVIPDRRPEGLDIGDRPAPQRVEIGRASCRERVCQYV